VTKRAARRFQATLLGTGCPVVSTHRYGAGTLVRAGDTVILVDIGSGVTQRLLAAGSCGAEIDAILITHMHSDHLIDIYQLLISAWHQNRDRPQRIFGPPGIRKLVEDTMDVWRHERALRIEFERRSSTAAFECDITELSGEETVVDDGVVRIESVLVDHAPVRPAFGYIFEAYGRKLVLSGDTTYSPNLIERGRGADLLVHEVFVHRPVATVETRMGEGARNVASYHTLSTEVGRVATRMEARLLALNHLVPPYADRAALLADAQADFTGPVVVGEDLMDFDLIGGRIRFGPIELALGISPASGEHRDRDIVAD
jgi:ribonuclease BN (tRNA processing enzyme)